MYSIFAEWQSYLHHLEIAINYFSMWYVVLSILNISELLNGVWHDCMRVLVHTKQWHVS